MKRLFWLPSTNLVFKCLHPFSRVAASVGLWTNAGRLILQGQCGASDGGSTTRLDDWRAAPNGGFRKRCPKVSSPRERSHDIDYPGLLFQGERA